MPETKLEMIEDRAALLRRLDMATELAEALRTGGQITIKTPGVTAWWEVLERMGLEFASATKLMKLGLEPRRGAKPVVRVNGKTSWDAWLIGVQTRPMEAPAEKEPA